MYLRFGHHGLPKQSCEGERKRGRQRRRREDNITGWTGKAMSNNLRKAEDREIWHELVPDMMPLQSPRSGDM